MEKSPDAFRTISEVAEVLDTPAHVLRFWESRFPQIRPVKRAGGRRYYRPADVALLAGIKRLLHDEGMTIRGVQKILREQGVRHVAGASDGGPVVDAYDILGLAEAVEMADRADAAAKVIDLSAHVRTAAGDRAPGGFEPEDAGTAADLPFHAEPDAVSRIDEAEIVVDAPMEPAPDLAIEGHAVAAPEPVMSQDGAQAVDALLDAPPTPVDDHPAPVPADAVPILVVGWLPTRLRALPPGALEGHAASLAPLATRLAALRDRMARPVRPGRG